MEKGREGGRKGGKGTYIIYVCVRGEGKGRSRFATAEHRDDKGKKEGGKDKRQPAHTKTTNKQFPRVSFLS